MDYLEWHGNQWRVRVKVPDRLRHVFGKTKLIHPLHTADKAEANRQKHQHVHALKARIAEAEKALASGDPIIAGAIQHRLHTISGTAPPVSLELRREALFGPADADRGVTDKELHFLEVATGAAITLDQHADAFASHKAYALKSRGDLKRATLLLRDWLKTQHRPDDLAEVNRELAGRFIDGALTSGRGRAKAGAYLGFLREYWRWLRQRGHVQENPWAGQEMAKEPRGRKAEPDGGKRPYTDDEVAKLIYGPAPAYLSDLMRIAALTGMRIEEICQLQVRDCEGGWLRVQHGKTENAKRTIPIHPDLAAVVEGRSTGKAKSGYLFDELPPVPKSREGRSDPASKRFTRYRRQLGVDERPNDKAKSNVDFHSFRRWFVDRAKAAWPTSGGTFTPWTIADVVGHDDEGIRRTLNLTMTTYPGQSPDAAKRACVEAVKLPPRPAPEAAAEAA